MNWKKLLRALLALYGVYMFVRGIVHMTTAGYAPAHFWHGALMTPTLEIVLGVFTVLVALFAPFTRYGD